MSDRGLDTIRPFLCAVFIVLLAATVPAWAQDEEPTISDSGAIEKDAVEKFDPNRAPYSPWADLRYPTRPLFGDTHLHTGYSMGAGALGAGLDPNDANRFARGEQTLSSTGAGETRGVVLRILNCGSSIRASEKTPDDARPGPPPVSGVECHSNH